MSTALQPDMDQAIASRVRERRTQLGLTIDELAKTSGVSRAMISRIERCEASPTATLLGRLANALGLSMSAIFAASTEASPIRRANDRTIWRDPASGYIRSNVAPEIGPADIVDVMMPPGADVSYDNIVPVPFEQYVWVLEGALEMTYGAEVTNLGPGDCLYLRLDRPTRFRNPHAGLARYAVVLVTGGQFRRTSP